MVELTDSDSWALASCPTCGAEPRALCARQGGDVPTICDDRVARAETWLREHGVYLDRLGSQDRLRLIVGDAGALRLAQAVSRAVAADDEVLQHMERWHEEQLKDAQAEAAYWRKEARAKVREGVSGSTLHLVTSHQLTEEEARGAAFLGRLSSAVGRDVIAAQLEVINPDEDKAEAIREVLREAADPEMRAGWILSETLGNLEDPEDKTRPLFTVFADDPAEWHESWDTEDGPVRALLVEILAAARAGRARAAYRITLQVESYFKARLRARRRKAKQ